jgi:hypothetical protein
MLRIRQRAVDRIRGSEGVEGAFMRVHRGISQRVDWSERVGYEWTGTRNPGYLTEPGRNNRVFGRVTFSPVAWFTVSNDTSLMFEDDFPIIARRNRFYLDTASATVVVTPAWNVQLGYAYQRNDLSTYMAFQNDPTAGYVLDIPTVPFDQRNRTWWGQSTLNWRRHLALNIRLTYNSAFSAMRPALGGDNAVLFGNGSLIQQGLFDPAAFGQALDAVQLGATQISEVDVPQWIGEGKLTCALRYHLNAGVDIGYGSYRDVWNPNLNGTLRLVVISIGRAW